MQKGKLKLRAITPMAIRSRHPKYTQYSAYPLSCLYPEDCSYSLSPVAILCSLCLQETGKTQSGSWLLLSK